MTSSVGVSGTESIVRAVDIVKVYGTGGTAVTALDHVTVGFRPGTFTAVVGPSGSGKSALLQCLSGLDRVTSGGVALGGTNITKLDDRALTALRRKQVGFIFPADNLVPTLTVAQNIVLPLELDRQDPDAKRLNGIASSLGLKNRLRLLPAQLSRGEQQRVAAARALMSSPKVIFADEPTNELDTRTGVKLLEYLSRCCAELGQTIIMATQDPNVAAHAGRAIVLSDGRVAADIVGPSADEVLATIKQAIVSAMSSSEAGAAGGPLPEVAPPVIRPPDVVTRPVAAPPVAALVAGVPEPGPVAKPAGSPRPVKKTSPAEEPVAQFPPVSQVAAQAPDAAKAAEDIVAAFSRSEPVVEPAPVAVPEPVTEAVPTVDEWEARLAEFDRRTGGDPRPPGERRSAPATETSEAAAVAPEPEPAAAEEDDWTARVRALLDLANVDELRPSTQSVPAPGTPAVAAPAVPDEPAAAKSPAAQPKPKQRKPRPAPEPQPVVQPEPASAAEPGGADDWVAQLWATTSAEAGIGIDGMPLAEPPAPAARPPHPRPAADVAAPAAPQTAKARPPAVPRPASPPAPASPAAPLDDLSAEDWVTQWWAAHETPSDN